MSKLRPIAFVLPQFHTIPENDEWWGKGFTEWTNVKKAKPLFEGHYQPHVPSDLGYYDLRDPKARAAQANIAKQHGIHGFCYYHYWFNGKRLLNKPVDEILRLREPDIPFMLCWANENWTRRWDGQDKDILIEQNYSIEDDKEHMRWLCEYVFKDDRYIRVDDKPIFVVYRHHLFPDIKETAKIWKDIAKNEFGYKGLYLCVTESFNDSINPKSIGFDAAIEFAPHQVIKNKLAINFWQKLRSKLGLFKFNDVDLRDFRLGVDESLRRKLPDYKLFRCVTPSWDNTARRKKNAVITIGSCPKLYYKWLNAIVRKFKPFSKDENFIFINAMNEWAEGNHLEPCIKYGRAYLEATKKCFD